MNVTLNKLIEKQHLTEKEAQQLMQELLSGNLASEQIASILTALRMKGETVDELVGFVKAARNAMQSVVLNVAAVDLCGTGGDGKGTVNISTASAFVVAGAGVPIAKHGNRAASSKSGSADVLEALGINIQLPPEKTKQMIETIRFGFFFAPLYHPSFKHVGPVRKSLGIRTIFNYLGPLLNPAGVTRQMIGAPSLKAAELMATGATRLGYDHVLIVTGDEGLDEISIEGKTTIIEVKGKLMKRWTIHPKDFGIQSRPVTHLAGRDARYNARVIKELFDRKKSRVRDSVVLNSAAALYVAGKAKTIQEGMVMASESIDSGKTREVLGKAIAYSNM